MVKKVLVEVQGARLLEAPKNLHLMVPKTRSIIAQQYVDGCAFFHVKVTGKSQRSKIFYSQAFYQKKCVCSIVPAGQYFSNLKGKQFKSHRSVARSTSTVQHLSDFSKNVLFFTIDLYHTRTQPLFHTEKIEKNIFLAFEIVSNITI